MQQLQLTNQICLGTSSNNTYIPGSLTVGGQATMDANLNVNALTTLTTAIVNQTLAVYGTSTFTSGFACGTQSTPYIVYFGLAITNAAGQLEGSFGIIRHCNWYLYCLNIG